MESLPLHRNVSLQPHNTFGIDVNAHSFATINTQNDVINAIRVAERDPFVLGGGSNLLLTSDLDKLVLHNCINGIELIAESGKDVVIEVGGGVVWHELVLWAVNRGYGGIENLSLIPGRVGAAPIQNIGAYGVELKEPFISLTGVSLESGDILSFTKEQCGFGYRDSVFKNEHKGKFLITSITLKLLKAPHRVHDTYGAIRQFLRLKEIDEPGIEDIMHAVIAIRRSKLPDPAVLGNAGSFFKNPVISETALSVLISEYPDMKHYPESKGQFKVPAGWLIEQCGWKGKRVGNVGCHASQALVIVNYGGASGQEVWDHATTVRDSVLGKFGVQLETEVGIL